MSSALPWKYKKTLLLLSFFWLGLNRQGMWKVEPSGSFFGMKRISFLYIWMMRDLSVVGAGKIMLLKFMLISFV